MQRDRYIIDALYGDIRPPPYVWRILPSPELQRLREVRLCNINSLCLTGGANINRYEHAIGTAHLALECFSGGQWPKLPASPIRRHIVLAALLHDIGSSAFGHSVQYVIHPSGFEHESVNHLFTAVDKSSSFSYQQASLEPVFLGMPKYLHTLLDRRSIQSIAELISGNGEYGHLIAAQMDFDNIDNVFRLAYHLGISRETRCPLELVRSMWVESDAVVIRRTSISLIEHWHAVRRRLYEFLLLNPDEFSAKCMLEQALTQGASQQKFTWHDVDFELIQKVAATSSEVRIIASRLMIGNLYGCIGIYETSAIQCHDRLAPGMERSPLESALSAALRQTSVTSLRSAIVRIHTIKDVGKTARRITIRTDDDDSVTVGTSSRRVLIGVFLQNKHLSTDRLSDKLVANCDVQSAVLRVLTTFVQPVTSLPLYAELSQGIR